MLKFPTQGEPDIRVKIEQERSQIAQRLAILRSQKEAIENEITNGAHRISMLNGKLELMGELEFNGKNKA